MTDIRAAAHIIASARRSRAPLKPLDAAIAPKSESDGYLVQEALRGLLTPDCGVRVGYKIGCTSPVMQQYLGIPHPCYGGVFAKVARDTGASFASGDFVRVGVECEMAVR